jgi:hypothetical protein
MACTTMWCALDEIIAFKWNENGFWLVFLQSIQQCSQGLVKLINTCVTQCMAVIKQDRIELKEG